MGSDQALVCVGPTPRRGSSKEGAEAQGEATDLPGQAPGCAKDQQEGDACKDAETRVWQARPPSCSATVRITPARGEAQHAKTLESARSARAIGIEHHPEVAPDGRRHRALTVNHPVEDRSVQRGVQRPREPERIAPAGCSAEADSSRAWPP